MKSFDKDELTLVGVVVAYGGSIEGDSPVLDDFTDDRPNAAGGHDTDTINRLFDKGVLSQVQVGDDNFVIQLGP